METTLLLLLPAVLAIVFLTLATVVLVVRRRRRRRMSATLARISELTLPLQGASNYRAARVIAAAPELPTPDSLPVRVLRSQVATLEAALEQEQHRVAMERQDESVADELRAYRRGVNATITALTQQVSGDAAAERILGRVAAAIDRLACTDGFTRPALSPSGPAAMLAPRTGATLLHSVGSAVGSGHPAPRMELPPADETTTATEPPVADLAAEPEVVLPVPVMAESDESRRSRRWFRGTAA